MAYEEARTLEDPKHPTFGKRLFSDPGPYDVYAIKYGYSALLGETRSSRHLGLQLLANNQPLPTDPLQLRTLKEDSQELLETLLDDDPHNPLFATDEDLYLGVDPRVSVHQSMGVGTMGRSQMAFAQTRRQELLKRVQARDIDPVFYSSRLLQLVRQAWRAVSCSLKFVGGALEDRRREKAVFCTPDQVLGAVCALVDTLIGPVMRVSPVEMQYMVVRRYYGSVQVPYDPLAEHDFLGFSLVEQLLNENRLLRLETQRAHSPSARPGTLHLLAALGFMEGQDTSDAEFGVRSYVLSPLQCPDTLREELSGWSLTRTATHLNSYSIAYHACSQ